MKVPPHTMALVLFTPGVLISHRRSGVSPPSSPSKPFCGSVRLLGKVPDSVRRHLQRWGGGAGGAVALNRVLFSRDELANDDSVTLPKDDIRNWHVRNILKLEDGDHIRAGVVDGALHNTARIHLFDDGAVEFDLGEGTELTDRPSVDVLLALPRPGVMGRLWPTMATLGVNNIFIVNAYRVEKCYFNAKVMREEEIRAGLVEGLMQAGCDTRLPQVHIRKRLKAFLEDELDAFSPPTALRVVGHPNPDSKRIADFQLHNTNRRILVAIGPVRYQISPNPEGGWMDRELGMLSDFGFQGVSLGPRALRTDVACSALIVLAHDRLAADE